jgi:hypothetical protein
MRSEHLYFCSVRLDVRNVRLFHMNSTRPPPPQYCFNSFKLLLRTNMKERAQSHKGQDLTTGTYGRGVPLCPTESSSAECHQTIFWLAMGYFFVFCTRIDGVKITMKTVTLQKSSVCVHCKFIQFFFLTIISTIIWIPLSANSRSATLREFCFSRVRFSLAVSKIVQAYVTSFFIDPSLDRQIERLEKLLSSGTKYSYWRYLSLCHMNNTH